jgi:glutaminase
MPPDTGNMRVDTAGTRDPAIATILGEVHRDLWAVSDGEVATYIPELSRARPEWFGISVATIDGRVYDVGDTAQPFTIQSVSKPFLHKRTAFKAAVWPARAHLIWASYG